MKIKELIKQLKKLDQDLEVWIDLGELERLEDRFYLEVKHFTDDEQYLSITVKE